MDTKIAYYKGDVTNTSNIPANKNIIIIHCCNNKKVWGKGVVMAISGKWPTTRSQYMQSSMELGTMTLVKVEDNVYVANIIGQDCYKGTAYGKFVKYWALRQAFNNIVQLIGDNKNSYIIHTPRIGCGLAGGRWEKVEQILNDIFINNGINVNVYDL